MQGLPILSTPNKGKRVSPVGQLPQQDAGGLQFREPSI
jgi:hypothetical protein